MDTEKYTKVLTGVIQGSNTKLETGETTLVIWNNEEHLSEWLTGTNDSTKEVRIVTVDSESLPQIKSKEYDNKDVSMVALCFSNNDDYSDIDFVYYLTVKPN